MFFGVFQLIKKWRRDKPIETILNLAVSFRFYPKIEIKKHFHTKTIHICDLFYTLITPKFQILTKIMEKISCPVCGKDMSEHDDLQTHKCLQKFIKIATNPVVYASVKKIICPTCKKDMAEHNQDQTVECLNKFIKQVSGKSD